LNNKQSNSYNISAQEQAATNAIVVTSSPLWRHVDVLFPMDMILRT